MKAQAFLTLVGQMMTAQQDYFKSRTQTTLIAAKSIEKQVRDVIKEGKLEPDEPTATVHVFTTEKFQEELRLINAQELARQVDFMDFQKPADGEKST